jgi:UPF0755 protein
MKKDNKYPLVLLIALLAFFAVSFPVAAFLVADAPKNAGGKRVLFPVERGASARSVAENLEREGLIRSADFAYLYARLFGIDLKAGSFIVSPAMSTSAILRYIAEGKQESIRVTIPEGLTLSQTATHLDKAGVVSADDFIAAAKDPALLAVLGVPALTAEGFLFPDTYFFPYGIDAISVVKMMVSTFFERAASITDIQADRKELYRKVILASIVEREYRVESEAPLIASVFENRLKIGMGLQSCATIVYIMTEIEGKPHPSRILDSDLDVKSDYNTYKWAGLPPGPIANPGLVALSAACNPPKTSYLYFRLTDPAAGTHSFTHSLKEHIKAGSGLDFKKAAD